MGIYSPRLYDRSSNLETVSAGSLAPQPILQPNHHMRYEFDLLLNAMIPPGWTAILDG